MPRPRLRRRRPLFALTAIAALALADLAAPASAAPSAPAATCGSKPTTNQKTAASFNTSGVNIRSGPSTSCTVLGSGYPGQSVTLRCSASSGDWAYVTDKTTGITGWVDGDYLNWPGGAAYLC
ncbi:SH3 domain-containing protein [Streptomyces sp. 8L]|uniref:SH3 domain-containing protein n=1 Tax=Streptomyces sp. 8L TaxID=2877242 RepID=UPI001CD40CB4|nr:SH3 domain-containing protein [Streptomyces sp. 8L]MCA1223748.1 SH3 domain-containing protein [Streptomyces sp. 8L]